MDYFDFARLLQTPDYRQLPEIAASGHNQQLGASLATASAEAA